MLWQLGRHRSRRLFRRLALGFHKLRGLGRSGGADEAGEPAELPERSRTSQALTVAGVTIANGGDNLGVYIPLFAREPGQVPMFATVFGGMTVLWCLAGYRLVHNRLVGAPIRRHGHVVLPFVLLALGLWILADARVLLR